MLLDEYLQRKKSTVLSLNVRVQFPIFGILEKVTDKDFDKSKNLTLKFTQYLAATQSN
jgi:hypothetical protein